MKSGNWQIALASCSLRSPIAFIIRFRLPTSAEMSGARSASAPESCEVSTIRFSKARLVGVELAEDAARGREERVQVLEALVGLRADAVVGVLEALDHVLEVLDRLRVESVLKSWSRSTSETVSAWVRVSPDVDLVPGRRVGREGELDLATGDLRERGRADRGDRAAAERRVVLADRERDQRLALGAELDLLDGADRGAADDDLVAVDELARVLELGRDLVVLAAAAQQHDDERRPPIASATRAAMRPIIDEPLKSLSLIPCTVPGLSRRERDKPTDARWGCQRTTVAMIAPFHAVLPAVSLVLVKRQRRNSVRHRLYSANEAKPVARA